MFLLSSHSLSLSLSLAKFNVIVCTNRVYHHSQSTRANKFNLMRITVQGQLIRLPQSKSYARSFSPLSPCNGMKCSKRICFIFNKKKMPLYWHITEMYTLWLSGETEYQMNSVIHHIESHHIAGHYLWREFVFLMNSENSHNFRHITDFAVRIDGHFRYSW